VSDRLADDRGRDLLLEKEQVLGAGNSQGSLEVLVAESVVGASCHNDHVLTASFHQDERAARRKLRVPLHAG
jgi:hypothetical protein